MTRLVNSAALGYGGREESQAWEAGWEIKSGSCCSRTPKAVASRPQSKGGSFAAALERRVYINPTRWFEGAPANVWEEKQQRIAKIAGLCATSLCRQDGGATFKPGHYCDGVPLDAKVDGR